MLERNNVLRLGAFLAISNGELDLLAVGKRFKAVALNRAEVNEHIGAIFALNKAETLGFVKPFNSTSCCRHTFYLYC